MYEGRPVCLRKGHRMGLPWNVSCRLDLTALSAVASLFCCIVISSSCQCFVLRTSYTSYGKYNTHHTIIRRRPLCYYILLLCINYYLSPTQYGVYHHGANCQAAQQGPVVWDAGLLNPPNFGSCLIHIPELVVSEIPSLSLSLSLFTAYCLLQSICSVYQHCHHPIR